MSITSQYYNENAQCFFDSTVHVDMKKLYDRFLPRLPAKGIILDAGCGSGRDSHHFLTLGYQVVAFDANESLVKLASEHLGQAVIQATFDSFDAKAESFDAIWACASLLHLPRDALTANFLQLGKLLKVDGVFYCSFKYGNGEQIRNGRFFSDMTEQTLTDTLVSTKLAPADIWISSDARPGREAEQWLNAILVKA